MPKLSGPMMLVAALGGFFLVLFFVYWVLETEFFRGDPDLGGSAVAVKNGKTALAHERCARAVARDGRMDTGLPGAPADYTAWDLGFGRYLVKAQARASEAPERAKAYLCRVSNQGGAEDWTIQGIEYLE